MFGVNKYFNYIFYDFVKIRKTILLRIYERAKHFKS